MDSGAEMMPCSQGAPLNGTQSGQHGGMHKGLSESLNWCMPIDEARRRSLKVAARALGVIAAARRDTPTKTLAHALSTVSRARYRQTSAAIISTTHSPVSCPFAAFLHASLCSPVCKYPNTVLILFSHTAPAARQQTEQRQQQQQQHHRSQLSPTAIHRCIHTYGTHPRSNNLTLR